MNSTTSPHASCPLCESDVLIPADGMVGEVVPCDDCGAELEVTALEPVKLTEAPEVAEDWGE